MSSLLIKQITLKNIIAPLTQEERNLHLVLSNDQVNLHSIQSNSHRMWPLILDVYDPTPIVVREIKVLDVVYVNLLS